MRAIIWRLAGAPVDDQADRPAALSPQIKADLSTEKVLLFAALDAAIVLPNPIVI